MMLAAEPVLCRLIEQRERSMFSIYPTEIMAEFNRRLLLLGSLRLSPRNLGPPEVNSWTLIRQQL